MQFLIAADHVLAVVQICPAPDCGPTHPTRLLLQGAPARPITNR
jgi:hypothetical protein